MTTTAGTRMRTAVATIALQSSELALFGLAFWLVICAWQNISFSVWRGFLLVAGGYFVLGAIPFPWVRRRLFVGVAAFCVPLGILGWVSWVFASFPVKPTWDELPRVVFGVQNLATAALACGAALTGYELAVRVSNAMRRRTSGCSGRSATHL